jgi:predicted O-methyltransferase YrrM
MTTSGMGGSGRSSSEKKICMSAVEELDRVLQMVIDLVFLDHEKGRVR